MAGAPGVLDTPKVYIVAVDYGYDGLSKIPASFKVFSSEQAANDFVRHVTDVTNSAQTLIVIPAEWIPK